MSRSAYDYSLDLLTARPYTVRNLGRKLRAKGFGTSEIDTAIARLVSAGLLDDRKFAFEFARQKIIGGGAAARRVKQALIGKGIVPAIADQAIGELMAEEPVDPTAAMERLGQRKLRSMEGMDELTKRRRLFAYLARRGYEVDDVKRVVTRLLP